MRRADTKKEGKKKALIVFERVFEKNKGLKSEKVLGLYLVHYMWTSRAYSVIDDSVLRLEFGKWVKYSNGKALRKEMGELIEFSRVLFDDENRECGELSRTVLETTENDPNWGLFLNLVSQINKED